MYIPVHMNHHHHLSHQHHQNKVLTSKMAAKQANWPFVINLGNSIIGVSVLAMPFCFKQCGVLLGTLLLCSSAFLTKMSCSLLIRGAHTSRKRSYEYLALHTFGPAGKLCVEISIIGLLLGTCVAFFVVIGDLGPAIVSRILGLENTSNLRAFLMVFLATFVALPLGLLKNIESLSNISAMSIGFYTVFVAEVFVTSFPNLWSGVWVAEVRYWNPAGVFKCLPIFSLAFACQTQLFVMYDALAEPSLKRISNITKNAIGMCTAVYLLVGYFGYVAFCREDISGDILLNFRPTLFSEAVKLGFTLSVAVSFPLVIFPLRAALYTLLFHKPETENSEVEAVYKEHEKQEVMGPIYIPDTHLKVLTFCIILTTLIIGILLPNIEFVLALTGATMGSMICFIFPAVMFISITSPASSGGKSTAQVVLFLGVTILLASTYVTLNAQDQDKLSYEDKVKPGSLQDENLINNNPPDVMDMSKKDAEQRDTEQKGDIHKPGDEVIKEKEKEVDKKEEGQEGEKRQEPPNPQAPAESEDEAKKQAELDEVERKVAEDLLKLHEQEKHKEEEKKAAAKENANRAEQKDVKQGEKSDGKEQNGQAEQILHELKQQQRVQEQLIEEQKQIIEELKQHQKDAHQADEKDQIAQLQGQPVQGQGEQVQGQQVQGLQMAPKQDLGNHKQDSPNQQIPEKQPLVNNQQPGAIQQNVLNPNQQVVQVNKQEIGNQPENKQPVGNQQNLPVANQQAVLQENNPQNMAFQNLENVQNMDQNKQVVQNQQNIHNPNLQNVQNVQQNIQNVQNQQQNIQNVNQQNMLNPNEKNIPLVNQQQMQAGNHQQAPVGNQDLKQPLQKPVLPELKDSLQEKNPDMKYVEKAEGQKAGLVGAEKVIQEF